MSFTTSRFISRWLAVALVLVGLGWATADAHAVRRVQAPRGRATGKPFRHGTRTRRVAPGRRNVLARRPARRPARPRLRRVSDLWSPEMLRAARTDDGRMDPAGQAALLAAIPEVSGVDQLAREWLPDVGRVVELKKNGVNTGHIGAIYRVFDRKGRGVAYLKTFPRNEKVVVDFSFDAAMEVSSMSRLGEGDLAGYFPTIDLIGAGKVIDGDTTNYILVTRAGPPQTLDDLIVKAARSDSAQTRRRLERRIDGAIDTIARNLAHLHLRSPRSGKPVARSWLTSRHSGAMRHFARKLSEAFTETSLITSSQALDALGFESWDAFHAAIERVIERGEAQIAPGTIVMGDSNPGNHAVSRRGKVKHLDLNEVHFSFDRDGKGIGSPSRDVGQLSVLLETTGVEAGMSRDDARKMRLRFERAYARARGKEARAEVRTNDFFSLRTSLRTLFLYDLQADKLTPGQRPLAMHRLHLLGEILARADSR